ncbi:HNH endonuclease [Paenibacillus sp. SN-8-1]|uniref:HNH endonuclease n=1 Tax=Paenibacillus sp. SN-8-1 TaxID=3435409 RepID=UPI003D9A79AF
MTSNESTTYKQCAHCQEKKPVTEFLRRTGRGSKPGARRGTCRACRRKLKAASSGKETVQAAAHEDFPHSHAGGPGQPRRPAKAAQAADASRPPSGEPRSLAGHSPGAEQPGSGSSRQGAASRPVSSRQPKTAGLGPADPTDPTRLRPNQLGRVRMRGRTDRGRGWQQEVDLELAVTLVREHAAVVVNPRTIRRLYTSKGFRRYILTRDNYTCYFCGEYGDTIDHLLPRAKGGHTTPDNCVCACSLCNQMKADKDAEEFLKGIIK